MGNRQDVVQDCLLVQIISNLHKGGKKTRWFIPLVSYKLVATEGQGVLGLLEDKKPIIISSTFLCFYTCRIQMEFRGWDATYRPPYTYLDLPTPPGDGGQISTVGGPSVLFCSAVNSFSSSACCFCRETTLSGSWMLFNCRQKWQGRQNMLRDPLASVYIQITSRANYGSSTYVLIPCKASLVLGFCSLIYFLSKAKWQAMRF